MDFGGDVLTADLDCDRPATLTGRSHRDLNQRQLLVLVAVPDPYRTGLKIAQTGLAVGGSYGLKDLGHASASLPRTLATGSDTARTTTRPRTQPRTT